MRKFRPAKRGSLLPSQEFIPQFGQKRPFYAVRTVRGMVLCYEWSAEGIAEAMQSRSLAGIIRCIEAEGMIPAEAEAARLFAAGQYEPTWLGASAKADELAGASASI